MHAAYDTLVIEKFDSKKLATLLTLLTMSAVLLRYIIMKKCHLNSFYNGPIFFDDAL